LNSSYHFFYKTVDRGLIEKCGPFGLTGLVNKSSLKIKEVQSGIVTDYLQIILLSILSVVALYFIFYI